MILKINIILRSPFNVLHSVLVKVYNTYVVRTYVVRTYVSNMRARVSDLR